MIQVLIVDDDSLDCEQIMRLLGKAHKKRYQIDQVANYREALIRISEKKHDVYLIDHYLGHNTGLDLIKTARAAGNEQPLILLTGQVNEQIEITAKQHGASDFLDKNKLQPFILDRCIRLSLERHAFEREKLHNDRLITIGILSASIAHQFNNINAMVIGNLEMILRKDTFTTDTKDRLKNVLSSLDLAANISTTLLSFSRNSTERKTDSLQDVAKVTSLLLNSDKKLCPITLELPSTPNLGEFNRNLIGQVVINFVMNARHATANTENPSICIRTGETDTEIYLSVSDNGSGIENEHMPHIFNPFFTTKPSFASSDSNIVGTGLGLSLCNSIISSHAGRIQVDSQVKQGSTFTLYLPKASLSALEPLTKNPQLDMRKPNSLKALVVDDERIICEILQTVIKEEGHHCQFFTEPLEAQKIFNTQKFDFISLDLQMPKASGLDLLKSIRESELNKDTRVVIISGWVSEEDQETAKRLGVSNVLAKPFSISDILKELEAVTVK